LAVDRVAIQQFAHELQLLRSDRQRALIRTGRAGVRPRGHDPRKQTKRLVVTIGVHRDPEQVERRVVGERAAER
jgi:hypothetical protein